VEIPLSGYLPAMSISRVAAASASNLRAEIARQNRRKGDLGPLLGISASAVTRRLSGETPLDVNELCAVAAWLDVPVTALLPDVASPSQSSVDPGSLLTCSAPSAILVDAA
jgi:transcriptional regulator with XRE-family HTH domain